MIRTLPIVALLAACVDASTPSDPAPVSAGTCGASQFQFLVGQPVGDGAPFLDAGSSYRVIYPDQAVTLDVDPERINVNVDDNGVIQSLSCG